MDVDDLVHLRLLKLGLAHPAATDPVAVVGRLAAVQSQDFGPACWALGQRVPGLTEARLQARFDAGDLLRTHVLRPTWHFVTPRDLRWLLALTGPRVHRLNAYYYRRTGLDEAALAASRRAIGDLLADGEPHTRKEVVAALEAAGAPTAGFAAAYAIMHAELEAVIVSGPRTGKQQTYALVEARVPPDPPAEAALAADRDAALAELTYRFFAGHGPATVQDLRAWASLTVADVRRGIAAAGDRLERVELDGREFWFEPPDDPRPEPSPAVHILQAYDEYLVGHADSKDLITLDRTRAGILPEPAMRFNGVVVSDARVAGHWKRTITRDRVRFDVQAVTPFTGAPAAALQAAADRHGAFLGGLAADVSVTPL
jgi:hypothetical protein